MLNHAELLALGRLCATVEQSEIPVRLELRDDYLIVHLRSPLTGAQEAALLNAAAHGVRCFCLDPIQGAALPPQMVTARTAQWVTDHPTVRRVS